MVIRITNPSNIKMIFPFFMVHILILEMNLSNSGNDLILINVRFKDRKTKSFLYASPKLPFFSRFSEE